MGPRAGTDGVREPDEETARVLMKRIVTTEALLTQMQGWQARAMQLLRDRRRFEQNEDRQADDGLADPWSAQADEDGWVASEIGFALGLSEAQVRRRLDWADGLDRYPSVAQLVCDGAVPAWTAQRLVEQLDELAPLVTPEHLQAIADSTVAWLRERPRGLASLSRRMRRLLLRAKAEAGVTDDDAAARAHADRDVRVSSRSDGCAELWALLPEPDALAVAAVLRQAGTLRHGDEDVRTAAQRRADTLVANVLGTPGMYGYTSDVEGATGDRAEGGGRGPAVAARIDISVTLDTLLGLVGEPGFSPGYGLVPDVTVRDLVAREGTTFRGLLVDADTGRLVGLVPDLGRVRWVDEVRSGSGYEHPPVLDDLIRTRDQHCRAPGCTRPASRCDCDHIVPWPHGQTSYENGCCLCRYHHRLKTHAPRWHVEGDGDGELTWTTPTGHRVSTEPFDHRPTEPPMPPVD